MMEKDMVLIDKESLEELKSMVEWKAKLLDAAIRIAEELEQENKHLKEHMADMEMDFEMMMDELQEPDEEEAEEPEPCDCAICELGRVLEEAIEKQKKDQAISELLHNF
jgi:hypothetical protein